jgi:hypothetical protein
MAAFLHNQRLALVALDSLNTHGCKKSFLFILQNVFFFLLQIKMVRFRICCCPGGGHVSLTRFSSALFLQEREALLQGRNLKRREIKSKVREEKLDHIGHPLIPYY